MMKNRRVTMYIDLSYLIFIGASLGAVLALGIFVAPVVFHSEMFVTSVNLGNYQEGLLMSEVFRRFSYWVSVLAFAIAVYELIEFKMMRRDRIAGLSAIAAVSTSLLFSGVYTPKILELQQMGEKATITETFISLHNGSELAFKILALSLLILFYRRAMLLRFR